MKNLSLKLQDKIFSDTENILSHLKVPRNKYINEAIDYYNRLKKQQMIAKQLEYESKLCADSSMEVLREMEFLDPHLLEEYDWGPDGPPM